ncbi:MAG: substrate-binding domain-containing protein [Candidatus Helarchaeota archaeon]
MEKIKIKRKPKRSNMVFILLFMVNFTFGVYIGFELGQNQESPFVTLTMVYSSEKKSWINSIVNDFFIYTYLLTGKIVVMNFQPSGSRSMIISTLTGEIKPTILSPASSIWIDYLNNKLIADGRHPKILEENTEKVIYSPIVIGTWNLYDTTWNITGFESLLNIPILRWSHTDPQLSNSGTMSVIMQVASFLEKNTSNLTYLDLWDPTMRVKMAAIEQKIPYYGGSTGFLAKKALDGTLDVFMVYENLIIDMNKKDIAIARGGVKAIYPKGGTLLSDHPFCLLTADWITPIEAYVGKLFLNFIQRPDIIAKAFKNGFRPIDESILDNPAYNNSFNSIFTELAGVQRNIPCPIYNSKIGIDQLNSYLILEGIPELWTTVRASG